MGVNKVVCGGNTLIDISGDTVTVFDVSLGKSFHLPNGATAMGLLNPGSGLPNYIVAGEQVISVSNGYVFCASSTLASGTASITVKRSGVYRVKWETHHSSASLQVTSQIYVNGVATGTRKSGSGDKEWYEDLSLNNGDVVVLYVGGGNYLYGAYGFNLRLCIDWDIFNKRGYVGGKIFYIDDTSTGAEYTFYNVNGDVLTDVRVGDAPYYYTITGTPSKEKYYVFNDNAPTDKFWTYQDAGAWVLNLLGTGDGIGIGKSNTAIVMSADNGAYANYPNTVWNALKALNDNADKDCTDWFVPSKAELEVLRIAVDKNGNPLTTSFSNTNFWVSTEYDTQIVWLWAYSSGWILSGKGNNYARPFVAVRSF